MFKADDKVRCIDGGEWETLKTGEIYTVARCNDEYVYIDINGYISGWHLNRFELVIEPKFKVGDKVRYVKYLNVGATEYPEKDKIYTVYFSTSRSIQLEEMTSGWYYAVESFELVSELPKTYEDGWNDAINHINSMNLKLLLKGV